MLQFINGHREPAFKIYDINYNFIETIILNLCDEDGMEEYNEYDVIWYKAIDKSEDPYWNGIRKHFTLNYGSWSEAVNSMKIRKIVNYATKNNLYIIHIIPRYDYEFRNYRVNYSGEPITLGIHGGGLNAIGNTKISLKFKTKYLISELDWINPNNILYPVNIHPKVIYLQT